MSRIQKPIPVELSCNVSVPAPVSTALLDGARIQSLLDLLRAVDSIEDLPVLKRRVLKANVRTAGFVAARAKAREEGRNVGARRDDALLGTVPVSPRWLNRYLFLYPAGLCGTSEQNRHHAVSGLRRVMRLFGLLDPYTPSTSLLDQSVWRVLLDRLEYVYAETALATFAAWCDRAGIMPHAVSQQSLETFETWLWTRTLHSEIPRLVRNVCTAWTKATVLIDQSEQLTLIPPARREAYVLPFSAYSDELRVEVAKFLGWFAGSDKKGPFTSRGRRRKPRAKTVEIRTYYLRQALVALVLLEKYTPESVRISDLVSTASFEDILRFYWERAIVRCTGKSSDELDGYDESIGATSQTAGIAATLIIVARHLGRSPSEIRELQDRAQNVTPDDQYNLTRKSRDRLRQFDDPVTRAKLLHQPRRLKDIVQQGTLRPMEAARLARTAAAIDLLLHIPIRNGNLCMLRLGVHLRYDGDPSGLIRHLVLQASETKNRYEAEWPIGGDLARTLDWYITEHRPLLANPDDDHLFPAGFGKAGSISQVSMYQCIVRIVAEHVHAQLNPHLFRCICAALILEETPGALDDVRLMLGDKSLETILAHYASSQPRHAAKRWYALLQKLRSSSPYFSTPPRGRKDDDV